MQDNKMQDNKMLDFGYHVIYFHFLFTFAATTML